MKFLFTLLLLVAAPAAAEPLAIHHGRLFIPVRVNGVSTEALLDSGAEATLLDAGFARGIGFGAGEKVEIKGSGGQQSAELVSGVTVEALGQRLDKVDAVVLDLSDLSTRLVKHPTAVILGRELFDAARLQVDMAKRTVRTLPASEAPPGVRLPLTAQHGIEAVPVTVASIRVLGELDFGNGSGVMISKSLAERLRLQVTGQAQGGGIGGPVTRQTTVLPRLTVAGVTFRNVPAQIDALPNAAEVNIGTSILRHFLVTTDFSGRAVWLAPARKARS